MKNSASLLFHFRPSDQELVLGYLLAKLCAQYRLPSGNVADCDLYGDEEPWQIWSRFHGDDDDDDEEEERDLYFFTPLNKMTKTGKRFERSVGTNGASWRSENKNLGHSRDGKIKWEKRRYNYWTKSSTKKKRKRKRGEFTDDDDVESGTGESVSSVVWIMHEYRLEDKEISALGLDRTAVNSCVLCRLRRKKKIDKRKKDRRELILEEEVEDCCFEAGEEKSDVDDFEIDDDGFDWMAETERWTETDHGKSADVVGNGGMDELMVSLEEEGMQLGNGFFSGIGDDWGIDLADYGLTIEEIAGEMVFCYNDR